MRWLFSCCRFLPRNFLLFLLLISAVPIAIFLWTETAETAGEVFRYRSNGWFRECAKWDAAGRRFLVSFMEGGLGEIPVPGGGRTPEALLEEVPLVKDGDVAGNSTLGLAIDRPRNRVVVAIADVLGNRYSAVAAYDMDTWKRVFLTRLNGPDEKAFADDVAVDPNGVAYVTDTRNNKIWKVGVNGDLLGVLESPLFTAPKKWYNSFVGLNGIVYHPDGFFLVVHTLTGNLFKIWSANGSEKVKLVNIVKGGSLLFGDGIELLSPTKLVVAGNYPSGRLVESSDGWETASVIGKFSGPMHRLATAATVKDGKVFLSHVIGFGYRTRNHVIVEAVFSS